MFRLREGVGLAFSGWLAVLVSAPGAARADDVAAATCTRSYESAQIMKKNKEYVAARRELATCIRECPTVIQRECGQWLEGLDAVLPSIVIHAEARGEDRSDVRVEMDGKLIAERIDGKGIEVDPGQHDFTFSVAGLPPVKKHVVVHDGEQLRGIRVVFEPPDVARAAEAKLAPTLVVTRRPVPAAVYILGGLGVAGVAGFAAFGAIGNSQRNKLERDCEPRCSDSQVGTVQRNLVLADVSLGVGIAAFAAGAVVWLTRPSVPITPDRSGVAVVPTPTGATVWATLPF